jgi:hypothetical protein
MRKIYGDMESRLEGEWVGNSEVRIYTGYSEARVKMVGDIPCRHEAHPDFDDTALDNLVVDSPSRRIRKLADILADGMSVEDGQINFTDESIHDAMNAGLKRSEQRPVMEQVVKDLGITAPVVKGDASDAELYAKHFLGDTSVLSQFIADGLESRSASKALLQNPTLLKDTPQGMSQIHRLRSQPFFTSEYRGSLVRCSEDQLGLTDDKKHNLRQYNSASLKVKVTYKRRLAAWARSLEKESLTAQCTATGWLERRTPPSPEVSDGTYAFGRNGLVRKHVYGTPIPPRDLEDHSVDSVVIARMYRPGLNAHVPVHDAIIDLGPLDADGKPQLPKEVQDTIEKFIGDEDKKGDKE